MPSSTSSGLGGAMLDKKTNNGTRLDGISSGEVFVRVCSEQLFQKAQLLDGLGPNLTCLLREKRKIDESMEPWQDKIRHIRQMKEVARQRRLQESQQWSLVYDSIRQYTCTVDDSKSTKAFESKFDVLSKMYTKRLMSITFQYYAVLEAEKKILMAWKRQEERKCQQLIALAQDAFNLNTFAMHLTRETSSKVHMWRLPEEDIQRQRCIKAATENIKKDFFNASTNGVKGLQVMEVYKIENQELLKDFHQYTALQVQMGQQQSNTGTQIKVKGLFCTLPVESLEHVIVYGMNVKKHQQQEEEQGTDKSEEIFTQNQLDIMAMERLHLVEKQKNYAQERVQASHPLKFPRRFSRYSTLEETRQQCTGTTTGIGKGEDTGNIRYLLLCRVAMGKTLRIKQTHPSSTIASFPPEDLSIGSIQYCQEEEYLIRSPAAVVPEFILQYQYAISYDQEMYEKGSGSAFDIIPTDLSRNTVDLVPTNDLFQATQTEQEELISPFPFSQSNGSSSQLFQGIPGRSFRKSTCSSLKNQEIRQVVYSPKKKTSSTTELKPDKILSNCAHQKRMLLNAITLLTKDLWSATKDAWETSRPSSSNLQEEIGEKKTKIKRKLQDEMELVKQLEKELEQHRYRQDPSYNIRRQ